MGFADTIRRAGGLVVIDMCVAGFPFSLLDEPIKVAATDSARAVHYQARGETAGGIGVDVYLEAPTGAWTP